MVLSQAAHRSVRHTRLAQRGIHEGDADPKLLAYQYLQVLPQIAQGESNKVWIIPSEITQALGNLKSIIPSPGDDGGS